MFGMGMDSNGPAKQFGAFLHGGQTQAGRSGKHKPAAIIVDKDFQKSFSATGLDLHPGGPGMFHDIGHGFLNDAELIDGLGLKPQPIQA